MSAIALELNEGEVFEETIKDLNILDTYDARNRYNISVFTEEGVVFSATNESLDMFSKDKNHIYISDSLNNGVYIDFMSMNAIFNEKTNNFVLSKAEFKIDFNEDYIDDNLVDKYKNLHYMYAEITLNYGNRIHYNLV